MILNKCNRGHYYDSDKFVECPYCAIEKNVNSVDKEEWLKDSLEMTETVIGRDFN